MMWRYWTGNDFGFGFGMIFMVFWWVIIALAIAFFVKWLINASKNESQISKNTALEILKQRYAKGEINKQEFEEKKKDLS